MIVLAHLGHDIAGLVAAAFPIGAYIVVIVNRSRDRRRRDERQAARCRLTSG